MVQIKTMLPYVDTASLTPEGLCFDAIMKDIIDSSRGKDSYFVNMCDGAPYYNDYYGDKAAQHTKAQVKKMRYEGIKVISYFITSSLADASEISLGTDRIIKTTFSVVLNGYLLPEVIASVVQNKKFNATKQITYAKVNFSEKTE